MKSVEEGVVKKVEEGVVNKELEGVAKRMRGSGEEDVVCSTSEKR